MKIFLKIQEFSRTPEKIQGQQDVFQESRRKRVLIANSRKVLGAQGHLATSVAQYVHMHTDGMHAFFYFTCLLISLTRYLL